MAGSPEVAAAGGHLLVVHDGGDGALVVPGAAGGGMHVGASSAEGVPDVVVASLEVLHAHVAVFVLYDAVPDAHQSFHLLRLCGRDEVLVHLEHQVLGLQVEVVAGLEEVLLQQFPVGVGHAAGGIPVALQLTALDVDGDVGIVLQVLLRVGELVEDVEHLLLREAEEVQAGFQGRCLAGRMIARHAVGADGFELEDAVLGHAAADIDVDDVAWVGHDARRSGQAAEGVAHGEVVGVAHLVAVAIYVVVGQAEELLVAGSVARGLVGELLPGVVLHLQHHGLHVGRQGSEVCVGGQSLIGERLDVGLQRAAGLVLEEGVQVGLVLGGVGHEVVEGSLGGAGSGDVVGRELHFLEVPLAGGGIGGPAHHVVALRAGIMQALCLAAIVDGPAVVPLVIDAGDGEGYRAGAHVEGGAQGALALDILLRDQALEVPAGTALGQLPVLVEVRGIHVLGADVVAGGHHQAIVADDAVVCSVLECAHIGRHSEDAVADFILRVVLHGFDEPVAAVVEGVAEEVVAGVGVEELAVETAVGGDIVHPLGGGGIGALADVEGDLAGAGGSVAGLQVLAGVGIAEAVALTAGQKDPHLVQGVQVPLGCRGSAFACGRQIPGSAVAAQAHHSCGEVGSCDGHASHEGEKSKE